MPTIAELQMEKHQWVQFPTTEGADHLAQIISIGGYYVFVAPPSSDDPFLLIVNSRTGETRFLETNESPSTVSLGENEILTEAITLSFNQFERHERE